MDQRKFDLFVSYSTVPDYQLARGLQRFLATFHELPPIRPRNLPALRICTDGGSFLRSRLMGRANVATQIERHLEQSDQLLVLCSKGAARSSFVAAEIEWFLQHRGPNAIHVAITEGRDDSMSEVLPEPVVRARLHEEVWYDLRGLGRAPAGSSKVRDAERERLRLAADVLEMAGKGGGLSADELYPDWLQYEQAQQRRRRSRVAVVAATLAVLLVLAIAAVARSRIQSSLADIRARATDSVAMSAANPEASRREAAKLWRELDRLAPWSRVIPGFRDEVAQSRVEVHRALFAALAAAPGLAGTFTSPVIDAHLMASDDGKRILFAHPDGNEHVVELWTMRGASILKRPSLRWPSRIWCAGISPRGDVFLVAGKSRVGIWRVSEDGQPSQWVVMDVPNEHLERFECASAAWDPDSAVAYFGTQRDGIYRVSPATRGFDRLPISFEGEVRDLRVVRERGALYAAIRKSSPSVLEWPVASPAPKQRWFATDSASKAFALTKEGTLYVASEHGTLAALPPAQQRFIDLVKAAESPITSLCALGPEIVAGDTAGALSYLSRADYSVHRFQVASALIEGVACLPAEGLVLTSSARAPVRAWSRWDDHPLETVLDRKSLSARGAGANANTVISYDRETLRRWTLSGGSWQRVNDQPIAMPDGGELLAVSSDGQWAIVSTAYATAKRDDVLHVAGPNGTLELLQGTSAKNWHVAFQPGGTLLAAAPFVPAPRITLWDVAKGAHPVRAIDPPNPDLVDSIAISQDGRWLAATRRNACVQVWSLLDAAAKPLTHCDASQSSFGALAFSPDDAWLAVGTANGLVKILKFAGGELLREASLYEHRTRVTAIAFDPTGRWLASGSEDGETRFWTTESWKSIGSTSYPGRPFPRRLVSGPGPGRITVLTQGGGGGRLSMWDLSPEHAASIVERLDNPPVPGVVPLASGQ